MNHGELPPGMFSPAELSLVTVAPASLQSGSTPALPSPGTNTSVTRIPSGPTVPDFDPASLHLATARTANPNGGTAAVPAASITEPSLPATPGSAPGVAGNPFTTAPTFDVLFAQDPTQAPQSADLRVPLFDAPAPLPAPLPEAPAPTAAPVVPAGVPTPDVPAPSKAEVKDPTTIDTSVFEVQPIVDVGVPKQSTGFDAHAIKKEFPILEERVHGKQLVWLDNAATTQKPRAVIERLKTYYERENSNIHRAAHALAARATDAYEGARETVRRFLNAGSARDVVFVRGATEGINLVAQSWGKKNVKAGDEVLITHLEHHANIVPWQMLCKETGAILKVAPVDDTGQILLDEYNRLLSHKTVLVALPQVSNALGTITPAQQMIEMAHRYGAKVLLDGAQSVSHMRQDVQKLGCDWFVFSGHKVFAPTGIGAVIAPAELLDATPPWQGGGNMIQDVTFEKTVYQPAPWRFEAGTGSIGDAVGLGAALDWLTRVGLENVERHEHTLLEYGTEKLLTVPGLKIIGTAPEKAGVLSFILDGHTTQDVSTYLDKQGIAVRGGHHCAQPILRRFGLESTVRASLAPYNTLEDLDALAAALCKLQGQ